MVTDFCNFSIVQYSGININIKFYALSLNIKSYFARYTCQFLTQSRHDGVNISPDELPGIDWHAEHKLTAWNYYKKEWFGILKLLADQITNKPKTFCSLVAWRQPIDGKHRMKKSNHSQSQMRVLRSFKHWQCRSECKFKGEEVKSLTKPDESFEKS